MDTNFFSRIAALDISGDLHITVKKGADNQYVVSVLLRNEQCGDKAKAVIPPLILKGTTGELDNGFFDSIKAPIESTSGLLVNMEAYLKQQEEAKRRSAMEKEKSDKQKKEKDAKEKKYKEAMAKADELEKEGKHREAWMKVPEISEYPEFEEAIRKRKAELSRQFAPSLFGE